MANKNNNLTNTAAWQALQRHHNSTISQTLRERFRSDSNRKSRFSLTVGDLTLDYSRNHVSNETIGLLCQLASELGLAQHIKALFNGSRINSTENRAALHTSLRSSHPDDVIKATRERLETFVDQILDGSWRGCTDKQIKHIVNIGIGGSHLGPKMATEALKEFNSSNLKFHFIASVDQTQLQDVWQAIVPDETLFIISSKTFSTIETTTNANTIIKLMTAELGNEMAKQHLVAVTAAKDKAIAFGIPQNNIFPIWEWVGGRYSIWSAIGLPLQLMLGNNQFAEFLAGAHELDQHFQHANLIENMPVILALLNIWYTNFFDTKAHAIIPYSYRLRYLVSYLQQLEMESNGKSISFDGKSIDHATSPVIFGEEGCNGQHTYHQLLHQGKHIIPADFIMVDNPHGTSNTHHPYVKASGLSQVEALVIGKSEHEAYIELIAQGHTESEAVRLAPHKVIPGNKPSNLIHLKSLNPKSLGALLALYEHKVFVSGAIWQINPFDQWGVELGKQLLPALLESMV